jgi:hypothetical protein
LKTSSVENVKYAVTKEEGVKKSQERAWQRVSKRASDNTTHKNCVKRMRNEKKGRESLDKSVHLHAYL